MYSQCLSCKGVGGSATSRYRNDLLHYGYNINHESTASVDGPFHDNVEAYSQDAHNLPEAHAASFGRVRRVA